MALFHGTAWLETLAPTLSSAGRKSPALLDSPTSEDTADRAAFLPAVSSAAGSGGSDGCGG